MSYEVIAFRDSVTLRHDAQVQVETLDALGRLIHEFKLKEQPRSDDLKRSELVAYTQVFLTSLLLFAGSNNCTMLDQIV